MTLMKRMGYMRISPSSRMLKLFTENSIPDTQRQSGRLGHAELGVLGHTGQIGHVLEVHTVMADHVHLELGGVGQRKWEECVLIPRAAGPSGPAVTWKVRSP